MVVNQKKEDSKLTVNIEGRIDTVTAPELQNSIDLSGITELNLDFEKVEYISSAGLRTLLTCQKTMVNQGTMTIYHPCDIVSEVFEVAGFDQIFNIVK